MLNQLTPKIGLLTPYSGRNLGDGAIQEAVIANIRARYPHAFIHGFTISPNATEKLHNIPCSALTSLSIRNYSCPESVESTGGQTQNALTTGFFQYIKTFFRKIPFVYQVLQFVKGNTDKVLSIMAELSLIRKGYSMLKGFDLLIVSGGGQLDDYWGGAWGHPFTLLKWGLVARVSGVRYIFLSVGTCTFESPLSAIFVGWALRLASYRSYRDNISKQLLQHLVFTHKDAVYPDLAFSYDTPEKHEIAAPITRTPVVGISPIAYLSSYYWPERNLNKYNSYIQKLIDFVTSLLKDDISVIFFHTSGTDKFVVREIVDKLRKDNSKIKAENVTEVNPETVGELLSIMTDLDFVIASRLHGVMLAHLMNKPVLAISYDRKVATHMEEVGQSDFCIDFNDLEVESMITKFTSLMSSKNLVKSIISNKSSEFKKSLETQYDDILSTLC